MSIHLVHDPVFAAESRNKLQIENMSGHSDNLNKKKVAALLYHTTKHFLPTLGQINLEFPSTLGIMCMIKIQASSFLHSRILFFLSCQYNI